MLRRIKEFCADQSGATAIEYAIIASGISMALIAIINGLGATLEGRFAAIKTALN